ncbi:ABC transporter permease [Halegenticoccus soli]|uniref:ABC transporter permease n=1 Tax=Halegenticoccus soli TaxID=1985678 RepID=UPI000C6EB8FD|nr:ABC transporter permease [Halegenticoccus soli]
MATDAKPSDDASFERVDWDALESEFGGLSRRQTAFLGAMAAFALGVAADVAVGGPLPLLGDPAPLDWLFRLTLLLGTFYVVLPLYDDPRMTRHYWRQFKRNTAAVISLGYLAVVFAVGTVGPTFLPRPELDLLARRQPPVFTSVAADVPTTCAGEVVNGMCHGTWQYPLGTNAQGHDMLHLLVFGMEVSMQVGLIATAIIVVVGTAVGTSAALFGGLVDEVSMRFVDLLLTVPTFFLFILIVYLYGGSLFLMILVFGLLSWGGVARLVRSEALQRSEEEYIRAAENAGASKAWILRRHVIPNVSNTVITAATLTIPFLILAEAGLSFLGLGDPTTFSWGQTIADGRGELAGAWWISTVPGVFLFFTVLAFNFLGDALRDALDPRSEV